MMKRKIQNSRLISAGLLSICAGLIPVALNLGRDLNQVHFVTGFAIGLGGTLILGSLIKLKLARGN